MVPSECIAGAVFNPTARPFALDGAMFVDNGFAGKLAIAWLSLLDVASARKWLMKLFHDTVYWTETLDATIPAGKGVALGHSVELGVAVALAVAVGLGLGAGPPVEYRKRMWIVIGSLNSDS